MQRASGHAALRGRGLAWGTGLAGVKAIDLFLPIIAGAVVRDALPPSRIPARQALLLSRINSSIEIDTGFGKVQRTLPEALVTILEEAAASALREAGITQTD